MRFHRFLPAVILAIAGLLAPAAATADFPRAALSALQPTGGQQGSQVTVTLLGADLDDLEKLIFSHPGISAMPEMTAPPPKILASMRALLAPRFIISLMSSSIANEP